MLFIFDMMTGGTQIDRQHEMSQTWRMRVFLRTARIIGWLLAGVAMLLLVVVAVENWTGARELTSAKAEYLSEGGTLELRPMLALPSVPEERNFGALEALKGITVDKDEAAAKKREALKELSWTHLISKMRGQLLKAAPALGSGYVTGTAFDWKGACAFLSVVGYLDVAEDAPAREVMVSLDRLHPLLRTLSDAAPLRTETVMVPPSGASHTGPLFELRQPHLNSLLYTGHGLALRAQMALAAEDTEAAVRSIQAIDRISALLASEPLCISLLTAVSTAKLENDAVWWLLCSHRADKAQLARLEEDLRRWSFLPAALAAMRGETAWQVESVGWCRPRERRGEALKSFFELAQPFSSGEPSWSQSLFFKILPDGFFDHNMAQIIRLNRDYVIRPLETGDAALLMHSFERLNEVIYPRQAWHSRHQIIPSLALPGFQMILRQAVYIETVRQQALAAMGIEKQRLETGKMPDQPVLPKDPFASGPMRLRLEKDGGYTLWSLGFDEQDDAGVLPGGKDNPSSERFAGDWVWFMPADG